MIMSKVYYTYNDIHRQVADLAKKVQQFKPELMVAIGGGGLVPARILRTFIEVPVLVVTLESYQGEQKGKLFKRQWIDDTLIAGKRILVVDELNDTGSTLVYCVAELQKSNPSNIGVAVIHDKDKPKASVLDSSVPYYVGLHVPDQWIVYPWESQELH
jgi:hypoxanthine phosphoribosyltransferase